MDMHVVDRNLAGKVAIVTGAGALDEGIGNGRAAAILLAREGARVVIADRDRAGAERTAAMVEQVGGTSIVVEADVGDPDACRRIAEAAIAAFGGIDVLVNNVGVAGPTGTAVDVDPEAWARGLAINVTSMMLMAGAVIPSMRARGGGAIVNISSMAGLTGGYPHLLYPTSKGAIVNMTRAMAAQHGAEGIRVNCVAPGMVYTPMVWSRGMDDATREARRRASLLQVEGTGWDVGAAVTFLASGAARWITGVVLPVDAGATAVAGLVPAGPPPPMR